MDRDGNTTERLPLDLDRTARVENGTVDMGAYEGIAPPPATSGLTAKAGDQKIPLTWSPPVEMGIAGYTVYRATSSFSDSTSATQVNSSLVSDTSFVDASVTNGTTYHYRVAATDTAGNAGDLSAEVTATPVSRDTIYVDADASGADDGTSWTDAYPSLQDALAAATDSSEIWVAEGVYYPDQGTGVTDGAADTSFVLRESVAVYGGFAGGETTWSARDPQANRTVLSGDIGQNDGTTSGGVTLPDSIQGTNSYHVVNVDASSTTEARLDGVTVAGGEASSSAPESDGAGVYVRGGAARFVRLTVVGNRAEGEGGAIYVASGAAPVIASATVAGNRAANHGGGLSIRGSDATIVNSVVRGNRSSNAGGGLFLLDASPTLASVTFSGNRAGGAGGAVSILETSSGTSSPSVSNAIFWRNGAAGSGSAIFNNGTGLTLESAFVEGGTATIEGDATLTASDVTDADPVFARNVDTTRAPTRGGNLRLQASSPALGAGDAALLPVDAADLDGDGDTAETLPLGRDGGDRVQDGNLDLGAYEGDVGNPPPAAPENLSASAGFGEVSLSWDSTLAADFGRYRVYQETDSTATPSNVVFESPGGDRSATTYTATGLSPDTTYSFYVTAVDEGNNESSFSGRASVQPQAFDTLYVDADAGGTETGDSWANAYTTLQDALQTANQGDRIWVADGVYYPDEAVNTSVSFDDSTETFTIPSEVEVYGGFSGGETDRSARDPRSNRSILSGDITQDDAATEAGIILHPDSIMGPNTNRLVRANSEARLDGVVVTGGRYTADDFDRGVVETAGSGVVFDRLTVVGNEVIGDGNTPVGIITSRHKRIRVARSLFVGNVANNFSDQGILRVNFGEQLDLVNTVATGNEGTLLQGGEMGTTQEVSNVTVVAHDGAVWHVDDSDSEISVRNSIFWGRSGSGPDSDGNVTVRHTLIDGSGGSGANWKSTFGTDGGGNLDADPRFVDPDGPDGISGTLDDDLRVADTGPAHNAGDASLLPPDRADLDRDGDTSEPLPVDILGEPRVQNGEVTMGAYEAGVDVPPLPPDTLRAAVAPDSTTLGWPSVNERDVTGYHVYRDTAPFDSVKNASQLTSTPVSDTAYVDTNVQSSTAYYYRVTAVDEAGQESPGSPQVRTTEDRTPPDAPASLAATGYAGSVSLKWSPSDSADTNLYRIYRGTSPLNASAGPTAYSALDTVAVGDTTYSDGSLTRGQTYYYRVTAVDDSSNESSFSSEASATPGGELRLSGLQPTTGVAGSPVRIYGAGFDSLATDNTVTFGSTQAPVDSVKSSVLYTQVPSGDRGPVGVSVQRASDGQQRVFAEQFTVVAGGDSTFANVSANLGGVEQSAADWGDYNGDGRLDVVVSGQDTSGDPSTRLYRNEGDGTFTPVEAGLQDVDQSSVDWGDYDGDGDLDLVVAGEGANGRSTRIYENEGGGRFSHIEAGITGVYDGAVEWGDFDGDGDLDLLVTGVNIDENESEAELYRNDGDNTFTQVEVPVTDVGASSVDWGDYDQDGDLDLVVAGYDAQLAELTKIYRNDGNGEFTAIGANLLGVANGAVAWGDYDEDSDLELVVTGNGTARVYQNKGGDTFEAIEAGLTGVSQSSAEWGDFDGDGALDLVVTGAGGGSGTTKIYQNQSGSFTEVNAGLLGVSSGSSVWGDYNGDGALDLLITGEDVDGNKLATPYRNVAGDTAPPDAPATITSTVTPDSVSLQWTGADSADVAAYAVYRDTAPIDSTGGPGAVTAYDSTAAGDTTFTDTDVTVGTTYHYRVTALDSGGNESPFSPEVVAAPRNRLYVDESNTATDCGTASSLTGLDGSSWDCAFPFLQDAFDLVNRNAGTSYEIWIAAGTYHPDLDTLANDGVLDDSLNSDHTAENRAEAFTLARDSVGVYGGFSGTETSRSDRDPSTNEVVLSGDIDMNDDAFAPETDSDGVDSTFTQTDHLNGANAYHVLVLDGTGTSNISGATVLDGLTVTAGQADSTSHLQDIGGGLYCRGDGSGNACSPMIANVQFEGNFANAGGAVFNEAAESGTSSPTMSDVTFDGNVASSAGGALFNEAGGAGTASPTLTRPTFSKNATGGRGGALYNDGGDGSDEATASPIITDATFNRNSAGYRGGAVYNDANGGTASPSFTNATFTENSAPVDSAQFEFPAGGGALVNGAFAGGTASPEIADSRFENNRAVSTKTFAGGGAIYTFSDSTDQSENESEARPVISNTTFSGNVSSNEGGSVYSAAFRGGVMGTAITGSDFTGNEANRGGALHLESLQSGGATSRSLDTTDVQNSTFANNVASDRGGAVFIEGRKGGRSLQTFAGVSFSQNEATAGGAVEVFGNGETTDGDSGRAAPTIRKAAFRQNRTTGGAGGALVNRSANGGTATPTVVNTVLAGNTAETDGGAVMNRNSGTGTAHPSFVNVTLVGNAANASGGAFANRRNDSGTADPTLVNSILWNNTADADGSGAGSGDEVFSSSGAVTANYSIIQGGCPANVDCTTNLLNDTPQFAGRNVGAGPDTTYGTSDDDFRLQGPGSQGGPSPGIDAGDNAALDLDGDGTLDVSNGLGGQNRRLDVADVNDTGSGTAPVVDMGAYESDGAPLSNLGGPSALTAVATPDTVSLKWSVPSSVTVEQYRLYRELRPIEASKRPSDLSVFETVPVGDTTYVDGSVETDTTYYYRVTAVNTDGVETNFSNQASAITEPPLVAQSSTVSADGAVDLGNTGTELSFTGVTSEGSVEAKKFGEGPTSTDGIQEANVSEYRYVIEANSGLKFDSVDVRFDVETLSGVSDPNNVTIYTRSLPGAGTFESLATTYNSDTDKLVARTGSFSEFALASDSEDLSGGGGEALRIPTLAGRGRTNPTQITISWSAPSSSDIAGYRVYRAESSFSNTTNATRLNPGALMTGEQYDDTSVNRSTSYFYRVVAVETTGFTGPLSQQVDVALPPPEFSTSVNRQFGDAANADNYRLVALPGAGTRTVSSVVSGDPGAENDFRAFREEGQSGGDGSDLAECGVDVECTFGPGKGFWLLARSDWSRSETAEAVPLSDEGTYSISLNPGWNLISNPFEQSVAWSDVRSATSGDLPADLYTRETGTWDTVPELASATYGNAYYINVPDGLDELVFPHPTATDSVSTSGPSSQLASIQKKQRARDSIRSGTLQAFVDGKQKSAVHFGVAKAASAGVDSLDVEAPPLPFSTVQLRALSDTTTAAEELLHSYRPMNGKGQKYPVRLKTGGQQMITLRPSALSVGSEYEVVLLEKSTGQSYNLRRKEKVVLQPDGDSMELLVLIGTHEYVNAQKARLAPEELKLLGNYPNPVTRATTIEYGLPEEAHVRLELYDILGRRVQTIVDKSQRAGFHRVQWGGPSDRSVASGVYFYRLQAGEKSRVKKMTVVR